MLRIKGRTRENYSQVLHPLLHKESGEKEAQSTQLFWIFVSASSPDAYPVPTLLVRKFMALYLSLLWIERITSSGISSSLFPCYIFLVNQAPCVLQLSCFSHFFCLFLVAYSCSIFLFYQHCKVYVCKYRTSCTKWNCKRKGRLSHIWSLPFWTSLS